MLVLFASFGAASARKVLEIDMERMFGWSVLSFRILPIYDCSIEIEMSTARQHVRLCKGSQYLVISRSLACALSLSPSYYVQ